MKSSCLLPPKLPVLLPGLLSGLFFITPLVGQDTLLMKNHQETTGNIVSVTNGKTLRVKSATGTGESTLPLDQIISVTKPAPADFVAAQEALKGGDFAKAIPLLKSVNDTFFGLPTPWAEQTAIELGEAYIEQKQVAEAEKIFNDFQKAYPQSSLTPLGLARLAVAKQNYSEAKEKILPILQEAEGVSRANGSKGLAYGEAYYLMGEIYQAQGDNANALESYLTAATIFNQDATIAAKAREKANKIREQKSVSVP